MSSAAKKRLLQRLHPRLAKWFAATYPNFTEAQLLAVPSILKGESILLTSPTGSGKTLAGFLGVFDYLLRSAVEWDRPPKGAPITRRPIGVSCIYVSPLRALTYDITKNLAAPIAGMGLEKELIVHARTLRSPGQTP